MLTGGKHAVTRDSMRNGNEEKECEENDNARDRHDPESSQDSGDVLAGLFTAFENSSLHPSRSIVPFPRESGRPEPWVASRSHGEWQRDFKSPDDATEPSRFFSHPKFVK
jgi:hypothetical protein